MSQSVIRALSGECDHISSSHISDDWKNYKPESGKSLLFSKKKRPEEAVDEPQR
jgi:hypothetical protein